MSAPFADPKPQLTFKSEPYKDRTFFIHYRSDLNLTLTASLSETDEPVTLEPLQWTDRQKFKCVERNGKLGFWCLGAWLGAGRYLGHDSDKLVCRATAQDTWERFECASIAGGEYRLHMWKTHLLGSDEKVDVASVGRKLELRTSSRDTFSFTWLDER